MPLKPSAQKVQDALAAAGFSNQVVELPDSTRTAAEAARAVGCTVGQIAKSLVFRATQTGQAVLVIASGEHRVDEALLGYPEIWAAAGHPKAVFRLTPAELVAMTRGRVVRLAVASSKPG